MSRLAAARIVEDDGPILICAGERSTDEWLDGDVDLRGRPW